MNLTNNIKPTRWTAMLADYVVEIQRYSPADPWRGTLWPRAAWEAGSWKGNAHCVEAISCDLQTVLEACERDLERLRANATRMAVVGPENVDADGRPVESCHE